MTKALLNRLSLKAPNVWVANSGTKRRAPNSRICVFTGELRGYQISERSFTIVFAAVASSAAGSYLVAGINEERHAPRFLPRLRGRWRAQRAGGGQAPPDFPPPPPLPVPPPPSPAGGQRA